MRARPPSWFAFGCGVAWAAWSGCGSQWTPEARLAEVECRGGRCFVVDAADRLGGLRALADDCGRGLLVRQATLMGTGDRIVLSGRLGALAPDAAVPSADGCVGALSDPFVARLALSAEGDVALAGRDPIAEALGVAGNAATVMAEGSYVVFAGDSNRTEKVLRQGQGDEGWQAAAVDNAGIDASGEVPAPTAQALALSDGRTLVVRPPGTQGRRLRLESLTPSDLRATTLWPRADDQGRPKSEGDLLGDVWNLRVFEGGAPDRILLFGGGGNPVWFSMVKPGFAADVSAAVAGVGVAWPASSLVPLPQFQAPRGYAANSLLVVGGAPGGAAPLELTEAALQLFDPAGNRWLSPAVPLPWPLLHTSPVLLPDGSIALIGGRKPATDAQEVTDTRVIYLHPDPITADAEEPVRFSLTVGRARMARLRGQGTSALLLPSGAVFVAGGQVVDGDGATENTDFEVLEPPYLAAERRPSIQAAPATLSYGESFTIDVEPTSRAPATVVLMAFGAVTNGRNVPQRHVELAVESASPDGRQLLVRGPDAPLAAPPGRYLLFVVDDSRVPSVGVAVALGAGEGGP